MSGVEIHMRRALALARENIAGGGRPFAVALVRGGRVRPARSGILGYCRSRRFSRRSSGAFQAVIPATPSTAKPPMTTAGTRPSSRAMLPP